MRLYDAHNHLQDERLAAHLDAVMTTVASEPITKMVVNGSCEEDWPRVLALARKYPQVIPSFGYHPWYVGERTANWQDKLRRQIDQMSAPIGEIGLDRWKPGLDYAGQEETFLWQLALAVERNLPVSIHCLRAWGPLYDLLRENSRPASGFLLHSYGGPQEMIAPLAKLGAYLSFPGYYIHERKLRQRETFKHVPPDRLLIETDAPDQLLPDERNAYPLEDACGTPLNHPANLRTIYEFVAAMLRESTEGLAARVEENFHRLFVEG